MKKEFRVIADLLPKNIRVLDVGCGDGALMNLLIKEKNIEARGLELIEENVKKCNCASIIRKFDIAMREPQNGAEIKQLKAEPIERTESINEYRYICIYLIFVDKKP